MNQENYPNKISVGETEIKKKNAAEELKSILNNSPDSIFVYDKNGNLIHANKTAHETQSDDKGERGDSHFKELDQMIHDKIIENYPDLIKEGSYCFESSHICYDGSIIDVDVDSNVLESYDDPLILSIVRNASETESSNLKQDKLYDTINNSQKGMVIENLGIITYLNNNLCNLLGYSKDEILGHEYINFFEGIQEFSLLDEIIKAKNGSMSNLISKMHRKNGSNLWMLTTISPIYNEYEDYLGNLSTFREVTQLLKGNYSK